MGTFFLLMVVYLFLLFGFLGCFINKIPGPIAVLIATLIGKFAISESFFGWGNVAIVAVLAIGSIFASRMLVAAVKKAYEFSKRASWGTTIGSIFSLLVVFPLAGEFKSAYLIWIILLVGLTVVPFIFAFVFELTNKNGSEASLKAATAATAAYAADTLIKLIVFVYAVYAMFLADKF